MSKFISEIAGARRHGFVVERQSATKFFATIVSAGQKLTDLAGRCRCFVVIAERKSPNRPWRACLVDWLQPTATSSAETVRQRQTLLRLCA
jgi:hypothetical protein